MAKELGLAASALSMKPEKKAPAKKEVREVRHRKVGKGFLIEHHHQSPEHPMEEHMTPDLAGLHSHLDGLHGAAPEPGAEAEPGAEPDPGAQPSMMQ